MKKRFIAITAVAVMICILAVTFASCSQTEEEFYASIEEGVTEFADKYSEIYANLGSADFRTSFTVERHFNAAMVRGTAESKGWDQYENMYNALMDALADEDQSFIDGLFGRDSERQSDVKELGRESNGWYDQYAEVEYVQNGSDNFYFKYTLYPAVWENFYEDFTDALSDPEKLAELEAAASESQSNEYRYQTVKAAIDGVVVTEIRTQNGVTETRINGETVQSASVPDGLALLETFGVKNDGFSSEDLLGFSNGNKIYTHVMQAQYRSVYALPDQQPSADYPQLPEIPAADDAEGWQTAMETTIPAYLDALEAWLADWQTKLIAYRDDSLHVTRADNTAAGNAYWSNYGEDITYDWSAIGAMTTARYTYDYNNRHGRLEQIDFYTEVIMPYYTENNAVDTTLVLKADVFDSMHIVMDIEYSEDGETIAVPSLD